MGENSWPAMSIFWIDDESTFVAHDAYFPYPEEYFESSCTRFPRFQAVQGTACHYTPPLRKTTFGVLGPPFIPFFLLNPQLPS